MVTSINYTRQCYFYVIIGVVLFDWGSYFLYFLKSIYIVLDVICSSMKNYQIKLFTNSGSDIINEVICCCSRMTSHFRWIITRNFLPIYIVDYRIASNKNFFTIELFAGCRLIKLISAVLMYCCFIVRFVKGGLLLVFSSVIVLTPWLLEWLSVTSVIIPLCSLDWVSWMTRQHWWLSKFELC